jgi:hypothetical protein
LAGGVLVSPNYRGVDHHPFKVRILKFSEDPLSDPGFRPAAKSAIN